MTTIAVKTGVMACDSMLVISSEAGGDRAYYNTRKVYPIEGEFIGVAGDSAGADLWIDWYMDGCSGKSLFKAMQEYDFDIVILHKSGLVQASDQSGVITTLDEPFYAIGSGTKCALAAMHMGATAVEAVEIAAKIDPHTGGKIKSYEHKDI